MKPISILAALCAAALTLPVIAQTAQSPISERPAATSASSSSQQYGQGGSKHCEQMNGAEKEKCLQDEGAKTDSKAEPSAAAPAATSSERSSSGGTAEDRKSMESMQSND